ncbi:uncharacterized protein [Nicotiana tomentosiformis]|uniref:uncharacterized protein n=1 Tax=Nicotiana tomentosiformis TaxID=4098 RepID=UPI00051C1306|nr:uncharacterized protein LOC104089357 [Nicotiana tomentosiformis]
MQKILKAHKYVIQAGMSMDEMISMDQFFINNIYCKLRGNVPKVSWRRLTCNNQSAAKWNFILLLTAHGRLYTRDRLKRWGVIHDATCPMCGVAEESISHLFYVCTLSTEVWQKLLQWQGIYRQPMEWDAEVQWAISQHNGKSSSDEIYRMAIAGSIYQLWHERNLRVFQHRQRLAGEIVRVIIQEIFYRGSMKLSLRKKLQSLNFYP